MSKRRKSYTKPIPQEKPSAPKTKVADSFENQLARLGMSTPNLMATTNYPLTRLSRDYNLMNSLYRNSWIAKKVINVIPEDMTKNWFSITAELTPEQTDRIVKLERKTLIREKITEGLFWGRLYGGAGAVILLDGHEDILDEPLRARDILPNSFKGLMVLDRWSGIFPGTEIIEDISDPEFGLPAYYEIRDVASERVMQKIHHSRVIRFTGRKLPFWEELAEMHWGASELEHVFDELVKRDNTSWNIASLVFQCNLLVNKVEGFDQLLSMQDAQMQQNFYAVKTAQNQMRNNNGMMIIGKEDELNSLSYTFSGINDIYQSFMMDIAGAAEIPVTKLFGRSPAGMNATGEGDLQNYYDMVAQQQETILKTKIHKLYPIMFMSEFGAVPKDFGIKFNPIRTPSDEQIADLVGKKVGAIKDAYTNNLITQRCAVSELHELSFTTNMFTSITDEDIEKANDEYEQSNPLGDLGAMLGGMAPESAGEPGKPPEPPTPGKPGLPPTPQKMPIKPPTNEPKPERPVQPSA